MSDYNAARQIIPIISDVSGFDEEEIMPEKHFYKDLEIDSIKDIEITVALEKKFKVQVGDGYAKITTVKPTVELANALLQNN